MHIEGMQSSIISVQRQGETLYIISYVPVLFGVIHNLLTMITLFLTASLVFMLDSSKIIFNW